MRVLYVEDNEVNQALVARVMRAKQCEVVFREEGEGALEVLAEDKDIDLVLLDIELAGGMTGLDVIRTLRARNDRRPVVAITAYAMMGDRERILEAGCDQYLPKPLVIPDLLNLLEDYQRELDGQDRPAETSAPGSTATEDAPPKDGQTASVPDQAAASEASAKPPAASSPAKDAGPPDDMVAAGTAAESTPAPATAPEQPEAQSATPGPGTPAGSGKDGVPEGRQHEPQ